MLLLFAAYLLDSYLKRERDLIVCNIFWARAFGFSSDFKVQNFSVLFKSTACRRVASKHPALFCIAFIL